MSFAGHLKFSEERVNADGSATFTVDYDEDFRAWFMAREGLRRMSGKRLEKWIITALRAALDKPASK